MAQATQFSVTLPITNIAGGWKDFGSEFSGPTVSRQGDLVVLEGLLTGAGTVMATLPEGFRPAKRLIFPANTHEASCRVDVHPNGTIQYHAGPVAHKWISLGGITFITKQSYAGLPSGGLSGGGSGSGGSGSTGAGSSGAGGSGSGSSEAAGGSAIVGGSSSGGSGVGDEEEDAGLLLSVFRWDGGEKYSPKCTFIPGADVVPAVHDGRRGVYLNPAQFKPSKAPKIPATEFDQINFTFTAWVNITGAPAGTDRWLLADWTKPWKFYFHFTPVGADTYNFGGELRRNLPVNLKNFGSEPTQGLVNLRGGVIKVGVWTHVAYVWNRLAGIATIYVNGIKVEEARVPAAYKSLTGDLLCPNNDIQDNTHEEWELGWNSDNGARHFDGWIADLEIRGRALTPGQVKQLADDDGDVDEPAKPAVGPAKWDIPHGSKWRYAPWGGLCTALWQPNGELWFAINPAATTGTKVWKTTNGDSMRLLAGDRIQILWDNRGRQDLVVTDVNTLTRGGGYKFLREPKISVLPPKPTPVVTPTPAPSTPVAPPKWDIPEGSKWRYDHWGGVCTALWQPNGELWMAINPNATNGTKVWKTTDGDGKRLVDGKAIKVFWDNTGRQNLVVTDINTITVNGAYHFVRDPKVQPPTTPATPTTSTPATPGVPDLTGQPKWSIPEGSKWRYGPWGGVCTALWQSNGELWMALNPASTNGTCVWKTTDGDAKRLLFGKGIKILWDNKGRQDLVVTDVNTLTRGGGYTFIREPKVDAPPQPKFVIEEGSKWRYDHWGGVCTALWQSNGELWFAIDPKATSGTKVWKTTGGDWIAFLAGLHIKCLWDNADRQDLVITDINTITMGGQYKFIREPKIQTETAKPVEPTPVEPAKPVEPVKPDPIPVVEESGGKDIEKDGYNLQDGGYTVSGSTKVTDGVIHITEAVTNQFGGIFFNVLPTSNTNISFSFDYFSGNGNGADGFCFFLADGDKHDGKSLGSAGGNLGYLPGGGNGVPHAYLGIGFDEYGNFGIGLGGAKAVNTKDHITVRGGGNLRQGYALLTTKSVAPLSVDGGWRNAKVDLDFVGDSTIISVNMKWYKDKTDNVVEKEIVVFDKVKVDQKIAKPAKFRIGLAAATGGNHNQHYVKNLKILYRKQ